MPPLNSSVATGSTTGVVGAAVVTEPKAALASKTLWLNALVLAMAGAEAKLDLVQPLLPVNVYAVLAFALPLLNMGLRLVTSQPLVWPDGVDGSASQNDKAGQA